MAGTARKKEQPTKKYSGGEKELCGTTKNVNIKKSPFVSTKYGANKSFAFSFVSTFTSIIKQNNFPLV